MGHTGLRIALLGQLDQHHTGLTIALWRQTGSTSHWVRLKVAYGETLDPHHTELKEVKSRQ